MVERNYRDALFLEQPRDELVTRIPARRLHFRHRREFRLRQPRPNALGRIGENLGLRGVAPERHRLYEAARAIEPVAEIKPQWISGLRELVDAHALFKLGENSMPPEDVAQFRAYPRTGVFENSRAAGRRRGRHVIAVKAVELGIEIPPGQVVGELGFLAPDNKRTATLECIEGGNVLSITYEQVEQHYYQNPTFGFYFLRLATARAPTAHSSQRGRARPRA